MKCIQERIDVYHTNMRPERILWRCNMYDVRSVIDSWTSRGQWWDIDETRIYIVVDTTTCTMEIFHSDRTGWMLSRYFD